MNPRIIYLNNMWGRPKEEPGEGDTVYIRGDAVKDMALSDNYVDLPYISVSYDGDWAEITFLSKEKIKIYRSCIGSVGDKSITIVDWAVNEIIEKMAERKIFGEGE